MTSRRLTIGAAGRKSLPIIAVICVMGACDYDAFAGLRFGAPGSEFTALGFSGALRPVHFRPDTETPRDRRGNLLRDSKSCARCHARIYANWHGSQHRTAFSDELFQDGYRQEPMQWCVNCHAPFVRGDAEKPARFQAADGISCLVCHVRRGKILTANRPVVEKPAHEYQVLPALNASSFCAQCHQFNLPTRGAVEHAHQPAAFRYSRAPMQNTYREWRESGFRRKAGCGDCHLRRDTPDSHRFPGGHDRAYLRETFSVHGRRLDERRVEITLLARGIGHAFPTGDPFRSLRLRLTDDGPYFFREFELARHWMKSRPGDNASRVLARDTTLRPPGAGETQMTRSWIVEWSGNRAGMRYQLTLDYLQDMNRLISSVPRDKQSLLIHSGMLKPKGPRD